MNAIPVTEMDIRVLLPEIILVVAAGGLLLGRPSRRGGSVLVMLVSLMGAFWATRYHAATSIHVFAGAYATGPFESYLKALILVATALMAFSYNSDREIRRHPAEIAAILLLMTSGGLLLVSSRHLLLTWLAFELLSVPAFALTGSRPGDGRSAEGGLKYAVFGGAASASLLYGFSLLYGATHSLHYSGISEALAQAASTYFLTPPAVVTVALIFVGAMYKLSAAPFHYWCPDAFEAASSSIAGFLSVVPKIAGFGLVMILSSIVGGTPSWSLLLAAAAFFSMTLGNLAAIPQMNVRRLLAYSTIAHAGYMLLAASVGGTGGNLAVVYYLTVYLFMNLAAFHIAGLVAPGGELAEFRGLGRRAPFLAVCMAVTLFSLTGLPPFGGFVGKLFILSAALADLRYWLIAALVINSVISLYVYARILRMMYFDEAVSEARIDLDVITTTVLAVSTGMMILLGVFWERFGLMAREAIRGLS